RPRASRRSTLVATNLGPEDTAAFLHVPDARGPLHLSDTRHVLDAHARDKASHRLRLGDAVDPGPARFAILARKRQPPAIHRLKPPPERVHPIEQPRVTRAHRPL